MVAELKRRAKGQGDQGPSAFPKSKSSRTRKTRKLEDQNVEDR